MSIRCKGAVRRIELAALTSVLLALSAGCRVGADVKASANANAPITDTDIDENAWSSSPAPAPTTPTKANAVTASAPTAPPAEACPLHCYEARGSEKAALSAEEVASLRTSLEPVLGRMRACTTPEDWRRRGSPFVNVRVASDGTLGELGVDPQTDTATSCAAAAARGTTPTIHLPGRKVIRCTERCDAPGTRHAVRAHKKS